MSAIVLIVDDDDQFSRLLSDQLTSQGYQTTIVANASEAKVEMGRLYPDVVLLDLRLPDGDGSELMVKLKSEYPNSEFIIITGAGSIRSAVQSTKRGATDYITKPFEMDELLLAIRNVMRGRNLTDEVMRLRTNGFRDEDRESKRLVSKAMNEVMKLAHLAAEQEGIVLLLGESGTGKDHLARWIHRHSKRAAKPFFTINCAALARELAESELFGHEPGAFTGTKGRKRGLLELAAGGILLLNEIGELDASMQSKLLTFLDSKTFMRVGGEKSISIDARIFAATNRDLEQEVEQGAFRQDLFYRLNVFPIYLPALRERLEDLPILVEQVLSKLANDMGLSSPAVIGAKAIDLLNRYHWPGNIRELRNVLERALIISKGHTIMSRHINLRPTSKEWKIVVPFPNNGRNIHEITKDVARQLIIEALNRANTKQKAAKMLGISRHALAHQIRTLNIEE
jgi:DNA-binding NtrC family response regulator